MAKYGDYLSVEDISSPFEAFGMTRDYKQSLVDKYNDAMGYSSSRTPSAAKRITLGGSKKTSNSDYDPGTFSYDTELTLPTYKNNSTFNAPEYTSPDYSKLGDAPTYSVGSYAAPTYTAPTYDEGKVKKLTQEQAASAIRGLRSAIQRVQNNQGENANVNRMTLRDALAGYGQGLQSAMSTASATARGLYNEEYSREADAAKTNFIARADAAKTNYQASVDAAKTNFEAQYDQYKMKWNDLSDAAKMNYTAKYNEAMKNYESEQEASKLNFQNLTDAKKLAYTSSYDAAKTNYATQADWKKTQYTTEAQKDLAEYNAALQTYLKSSSGKGLSYGGSEASSSNSAGLYGDDYLNSEIERTSMWNKILYGKRS